MSLRRPQADLGFRHRLTKGSTKPPGWGFLSVPFDLVLLRINFYYSTPSSCTVGYSSSDPHLVRKESHSPQTKASKLQPLRPRILSHMLPLNQSLWTRGGTGMVNFAQVAPWSPGVWSASHKGLCCRYGSRLGGMSLWEGTAHGPRDQSRLPPYLCAWGSAPAHGPPGALLAESR